MPSPVQPRDVVIVGGGVGAVEALLALTDLGDHALRITVVAPNDRFALRALTVAEPFAAGHHADVASLADVVREHGAALVTSLVTAVDGERRTVTCANGQELSYDALVLAPGARARQAYNTALTFGLRDPLAYNGLLADLEQGYADSIAFVVPDGTTWSLPLYEIALMTARQVYGMGRDVDLHFLTPEAAPLAVFGPEASGAIGELFAEIGIALHCGAPVTVGRGRVQVDATGLHLNVDRVVSLPVLDAIRLPGVPVNTKGFIAVDEFCRVPGLPGVYAIGDATDLLVKQGGLACQQADVAARHIAHEAGGALAAEPFVGVLRGRLLTGGADRFLRRDLRGAHGESADEALWWPPAKVYGTYLGPWVALHQLGGHAPPAASAETPEGIDVEVPLRRHGRFGPRALLELDSLGAMHD
ncbi:MAG: sulfide:quinone oxidoreductase [Solirubrobacteraceae bacterium]|nr:sulfide:quinone oxidoreductase [Solirubrobacteraceae bacterium]